MSCSSESDDSDKSSLDETGDDEDEKDAGNGDGDVEEDPTNSETYTHVDKPLKAGQQLEGECPDGFVPQEGDNQGFMSDGQERRFDVVLPSDLSSPRPVFLVMTGTVEPELFFRDTDSQLDKLPEKGWITVTPYRLQLEDGRRWPTWYDGVDPPSMDEGPDIRFIISMVKCMATVWPIDAGKIYLGGISSGGSITNRALAFASDFFAGGIVGSGNWYDGAAAPATPIPMDYTVAMIIWGGELDQWPMEDPLSIYDKETKMAADYFSAQEKVITISCTHQLGHQWNRDWTPWMTETLLNTPKQTDPSDFVLEQPTPEGMTCVLGPYQDH